MRHTSSNSVELKVSAKRMWLGIIEDGHNCLPKCLGDIIDAVEYDRPALETGCVRTIRSHEESYVKEKFEEVDKEKLKVKIRVIEGGLLNIYFTHYNLTMEFKEGAHPGTCILQGSLEYESLTEEELPEDMTEGMLGAVRAVEDFLIENEELYA